MLRMEFISLAKGIKNLEISYMYYYWHFIYKSHGGAQESQSGSGSAGYADCVGDVTLPT